MQYVNRRELKYYITKEDSINLQIQLSKLLHLDRFAEQGYYRVRSMYFDSFNDIDFNEKLNGNEKRKKIRLRTYENTTDLIKLELKDKNGIYQRKISLPLSKTEAYDMLHSNYSFLLERSEDYAKLIYIIVTEGLYRPKIIIEYNRCAFIYHDFDTRITIDENIRSCNSYQNFFEKELPFIPRYNGVILEVKYNGILINQIQKILECYSLFQVSASKYSISRGGE